MSRCELFMSLMDEEGYVWQGFMPFKNSKGVLHQVLQHEITLTNAIHMYFVCVYVCWWHHFRELFQSFPAQDELSRILIQIRHSSWRHLVTFCMVISDQWLLLFMSGVYCSNNWLSVFVSTQHRDRHSEEKEHPPTAPYKTKTLVSVYSFKILM